MKLVAILMALQMAIIVAAADARSPRDDRPTISQHRSAASGAGRAPVPALRSARVVDPCDATCNVIDFSSATDGAAIGTVLGTPEVRFGSSWLGLVDADAGGDGNFANEPSPSTIAFFLTPVDPITFSEGVSFVEVFYVASDSSVPVTLTAYDGPDGTGKVVAVDTGPTVGTSFDGAPCGGDPDGDYCLWDALTLTTNDNKIRSLVLSGAVANRFGFDDMTFCVSGDADEDGLLDSWETCGIDVDSDGTIELDLPALGADPAVPDVFVEVDAMVGRAPSAATLDDVASAFAANGVTLHNQLDETDIPLAAWPNGFKDFDGVKAARFGTAAERASASWTKVRDAKRLAFRYCVFADQYGGGNSSGLAELGGDDFMVTLGHPDWPTTGGTADEQAGTYMHELGHTLGLQHGGGDSIHRKPNYHSVMNYTWQLPTAATATYWSLGYSDRAYSTLDESSLSEASGIGGTPDQAVPVGPPPQRLVQETGPVDWNNDGDDTDTGVASDVNRIYASLAASPGQTLAGYDDWEALDANFRDSPDFGSGVHLFTTANTEMDATQYLTVKDVTPLGRWEARLGELLIGAIGNAQDVDTVFFYAPRSSVLTLTAKAQKRALQPTITLTGPDAETLATAAGTSTAKLQRSPAGRGGLHRLTIVGLQGSSGTYAIKTKVKFRAKPKAELPVGIVPATWPIEGVPGMRIKKLSIKALKPKGEFAVVDGMTASGVLPSITLRSPNGPTVDLADVLTLGRGKATIQNLELAESGIYLLQLSGTPTWVALSATLAFDNTKGVSEEPVP